MIGQRQNEACVIIKYLHDCANRNWRMRHKSLKSASLLTFYPIDDLTFLGFIDTQTHFQKVRIVQCVF